MGYDYIDYLLLFLVILAIGVAYIIGHRDGEDKQIVIKGRVYDWYEEQIKNLKDQIEELKNRPENWKNKIAEAKKTFENE